MQENNDLIVRINNNQSKATIQDYFTSDTNKVEKFTFDDDNEKLISSYITSGTIGDDTINGTSISEIILGLDGDDSIYGGTGNDYLNGGNGTNILYGELGDDIYQVSSSFDSVNENNGEGIDTVKSTITYTLNSNVENLILEGTSDINGTGNSLDNFISGNDGINTLTGDVGNDYLDGKSGTDILVGGAGDDIFIVDNTGDTITEATNEGDDTILSSVTYTLSNNVENINTVQWEYT